MGIHIPEGAPGQGKSLTNTVRIMEHVRLGGTVCTNLPLFWDVMKADAARLYGVQLEDSQLISWKGWTSPQIRDFAKHIPMGTRECPVLIIIDECWRHFSSRGWAEMEKHHKETLDFLCHHRHYHTEVYLMIQAAKGIDKQMWLLRQDKLSCLNLSEWSVGPIKLKLPIPWIIERRVAFDDKTTLGLRFFKIGVPFWNWYDSWEKMSGVREKEQVGRLKLQTVEKEKKPMKAWLVFAVVCVLCVVGGLWWGLSRFTTGMGGGSAPSAAVVASGKPEKKKAFGFSGAAKSEGSEGEKVEGPRAEVILSWTGTHVRTKEGGDYILGWHRPDGMVQAIHRDRVLLVGEDRQTVYLVPNQSVPVPASVVTPSVWPAAVAPVGQYEPMGAIAQNVVRPGPLTRAAEAELAKALRKPIGPGGVTTIDDVVSSGVR